MALYGSLSIFCAIEQSVFHYLVVILEDCYNVRALNPLSAKEVDIQIKTAH